MNFVSVNDYLANVAQVCRKAPTTTLQHAYMRAYREWCQQSQWLKMDLPGATEINVAQYALGNDPQLDIIGIYAMQGSQSQTQGIQFWPIVPSDSGQWDPNLQPGQAQMPVRYQYIPEAQFALNPTPTQVYGLVVTLILTPKEGAINVPESPLVKYSNDIEAGALEYLLGIPGMPWTDKGTAAVKGREFRSGISNGKAEAQRKYNVGAQRVRPRQFII
jgi:hypothetical protein